jgi:Ca-activated chloride channel family protein
MSFANPQLLWLLLVIPPALVAFFWWSWRTRKKLITQFIQARLLPSLTIGISPQRQKIRLACMVLAVTCVIIAMAGPRWGFDWQEAKQRGLDIVVAIDTSKSMLAEDITPNRLERAKLAALDLMQQAKSDRLGLVVFAGSAFLQCPLTIDDAAFRQSVHSLDVNTIPQGGTALAEAIETAATAFKEGDNFKVMVLFTDGEDQDSGAVEAAKKAAASGMQIFTIGIGSAEGELLRLKDAKGRTDYIRDDQGNVVKSRLNEPLLREIATETKGFYLPLRGAKTIDTLYKEGLAPLPKSESKEKLVKQYHEQFHWPLAMAIVLLLAEMFFPERKREPQPITTTGSSRALREAVTLFLLLLLPSVVLASTASALREYKSGKYDEALKEYDRLLERKSDDPRLHFNAGAAAYQSHQFDNAAKRFNDALNSPDLRLQQQAYYNRGNTLYQIGKNIPDLPKKIETWEKSLKDYQSALKLNVQDADAKFNLEFVKRKIEEAKQEQKQEEDSKNTEPSEEAKKAKAEADKAVERREYAKALQIMETQLQKDPTTQYYSGYMKRLKDVNEAQDTTTKP